MARRGSPPKSQITDPNRTSQVLNESTRTKLLDAAGQVFAESGYHVATIRKICDRAGANVALVNYHFGDKLELYTEVLRGSLLAGRIRLGNQEIDDAYPEQAFRDLILAMLQAICSDDRPAWRIRLIMHELAEPTPALSRVIDEAMRPVYDRFRGLIGAILNLPPGHTTTRLCTHSTIAQIAHYVHSRHVIAQLWPDLKMTPTQILRIASHIADFSLAYLRETASTGSLKPAQIKKTPIKKRTRK